MIANIASDDALILPHRANPTGLNFRERHRILVEALRRQISSRQRSRAPAKLNRIQGLIAPPPLCRM
jgi:hypothetical protein